MRRYSCLYPKGTYQYKQFYYRGGNNYSEQEYIQKKSIDAIQEFKTAKKDLNQSKSEYNATDTTLGETNTYLSMLSQYLGGESSNAYLAMDLAERVEYLMNELDKTDKELEEAKANVAPSIYLPLSNEKAQYTTKFSLLTEQCSQSLGREKQSMQNIASILISQKYSYSIDVLAEYDVAAKCDQYLVNLNNQKFGDVNLLQPETQANELLKQTTAISSDLQKYSTQHEKKVESDINNKLSKLHEQSVIQTLIKQLEDFKKYCKGTVDIEKVTEYMESDQDEDPNLDLNQFFNEDEENDEEEESEEQKYKSKRTILKYSLIPMSNFRIRAKVFEKKNKKSSNEGDDDEYEIDENGNRIRKKKSRTKSRDMKPSGNDLWGEEFPFKVQFGEDGKVIHTRKKANPLSLRRFVTKQMSPLFQRISHKDVLSDDEYDDIVEDTKRELEKANDSILAKDSQEDN